MGSIRCQSVFIFKLFKEFLYAVEVQFEGDFGIDFGPVAEDSDGSGIA